MRPLLHVPAQQLARRLSSLHAPSVPLQLANHLKGQAGEVAVYPADMSDPAAIDNLAKTVLEKHGGVDILVNNAVRPTALRCLGFHVAYAIWHASLAAADVPHSVGRVQHHRIILCGGNSQHYRASKRTCK